MKRKPLFKNLLILALTLGAVSVPLDSQGANQAKIKQDVNTLKNNESKIKELDNKINQTKQEEKKTKSQIAVIQQDLEKASLNLEKTNRNYDTIHKKVESVTQTLADAERQWETRMEEAQLRLRRMYKTSHYSKINRFAEARDFSSFVRQVSYYQYLAKQDQKVLDELQIEKDNLERMQYNQMLERAKLGKVAREQAAAKNKFEYQKQKEVTYLSRITRERQVYERERRALERESQRITNEIKRMLAGNNSTANIQYGTGRMMHPVAGHPMTSPFGYRVHPIYGSRRLHTGMDIGAPMGVKIRAADSGVIIHSGWRGGYGKAVLIDHGKGIVTLYGHASALYVRHGQRVKKGDVIAAIGSTGYSTGPHLHWEVRKNGTPVDPRGYM